MSQMITSYLEASPTLLLGLLLVFCFWLLTKSADIMVDEATSLALHMGIPPLIIGSTVVALATSLPEVAISVLSALEGSPDIALGNAVGSIIANSGLAIGLVIVYGNIPVDRLTRRRHGIIQYGVGLLLIIFSLPFMSARPGGYIAQPVGFLFLFLLALYVYKSVHWSARSGLKGVKYEEGEGSVGLQLVKMLVGAGLLIISSRLLISLVQVLALRVGIPQAVIAATLLAFGTSLPEVMTTLSAVKKGQAQLAVGNIVGSDIMNGLLVVGASAAVTPGGLLVTPSFYYVLFPAMFLILTVFRLGQVRARPYIPHRYGLILLALYTVFIVVNFTLLR